MSVSETPYEPPSDSQPRMVPVGTRLDAAHVRADDEIAEGIAPVRLVDPAPSLALSAVAAVQQVRSQATQLAAHLQRQQVSVDHREAELNARLADMESQVRSARLWLSEHHLEISRQKAELYRREKEIAERESRLAPIQNETTGSWPDASAASSKGSNPAERTVELDRRERELDALAERLAGRLAAAEQVEDVQQALRALETRNQNLERAEKSLSIDQAELERQRRLLAEERVGFAEQAQADRQKLFEEQQRSVAHYERIGSNLERQSDELATRREALERMRAEFAHSQHEALEIRLATEELWSRLCGTMAPAALTQSLAQIRLKLAEEHRLTRSELAEQKSELQMLSVQLAEQHQKLAQQREDLHCWAQQRQIELEKQSGLLVAQQQQIGEERAGFRQMSSDWQNERFRLQQEIRRLLRQLPRTEKLAA